ncbi:MULTISPECIES: lycopene cyclase domain-containing protein [unclassified Curtobacterium]|uniref:lycopene cyclase domain-containing protein n=1 Tax=unclassified Curtobacterium TaxID=257496 RepID=UPI000FB0AAD0|nr:MULTISPECIES: lycopene cyclase domain-containing protein [unclassified Curtobacterium]ROP65191.1 lycopene cyclase domain-containing protein [Curtobacterium sp. ZW137]TCK65454.1 lycopene cyclase domain-containing protein [Curtobacterium sp. PhB136]
MTGSGAYALLALPFFAIVAVVGVVAAVVGARRARRTGRSVHRTRRIGLVTGLVTGIALLAMTIVFDNVIVSLRIVAYDPSLISGAKIGAIPVEDLAYSIAAVVLLPALWVLLSRDHARSGPDRATSPVPENRPRPRPEDPR